MISEGFAILRNALAPYIGRELGLEFGTNVWWRDGVMKVLRDEQKKNCYAAISAMLTDSSTSRCARSCSTYTGRYLHSPSTTAPGERAVGYCNRLAHIGGQDFSVDDTWRAHDGAPPNRFTRRRGILAILRTLGSLERSAAVTENVIPRAGDIQERRYSQGKACCGASELAGRHRAAPGRRPGAV